MCTQCYLHRLLLSAARRVLRAVCMRRYADSAFYLLCFRTVAAAVSASFLTQSRFQLSGAFTGIPYLEAQGGIVSRRRMPRVRHSVWGIKNEDVFNGTGSRQPG